MHNNNLLYQKLQETLIMDTVILYYQNKMKEALELSLIQQLIIDYNGDITYTYDDYTENIIRHCKNELTKRQAVIIENFENKYNIIIPINERYKASYNNPQRP